MENWVKTQNIFTIYFIIIGIRIICELSFCFFDCNDILLSFKESIYGPISKIISEKRFISFQKKLQRYGYETNDLS